MKSTLLIAFGTRPEAIKMCPLVNELKNNPSFNTIVCVTGQHREMLDQVLSAFDVRPDFDLSIMKEGQTLFEITSRTLMRMQDVFDEVKPDVALVHGDTTTSFAVALAAFYKHIPVGHVEAGLRTYNMQSPYPEEFNREAVDLVTRFYFAPTEQARKNLLAEGKPDEHIYVTGNTGIDALRTTVRKDYKHDLLDWAAGHRLLLVTAHRRENLGNPLRQMLRAIRRCCENHDDVRVLYPVHPNPQVRSTAKEVLEGCDDVKLIEPLDVFDFHNIMDRSYMILTDSGGIQEEAPSLGKPVLVMRDTTERPEGVEAGTLRLVGTDEDQIIQACELLLNSDEEYQKMSRASNPYGDGHASERINRILQQELQSQV